MPLGGPISLPSGPHVAVLGGEHGSPTAVALTPYDLIATPEVFPNVPTPSGRPFEAFTCASTEVSALFEVADATAYPCLPAPTFLIVSVPSFTDVETDCFSRVYTRDAFAAFDPL